MSTEFTVVPTVNVQMDEQLAHAVAYELGNRNLDKAPEVKEFYESLLDLLSREV